MNCSSWDIESDRLKLPNNLKIKILKKWKKTAREIILYMCTNHLMYSFHDTDWDTEFFIILGHFLPFYPTNNPHNQNFEKLKKAPRYIIRLH